MSNERSTTHLSMIILAAGASERFGTPKQFVLLHGIPLFLHSVLTFYSMVEEMVIAVPENSIDIYQDVARKHNCPLEKITFIAGGKTRTQSVRNAMQALRRRDGIVAIHDAARPLASRKLLYQLIQSAQIYGGAAPGEPITDTILMSDEQNTMRGTYPRQNLWRIATPQVFNLSELIRAYNSIGNESFTDDTQVFHRFGGKVKIIRMVTDNLKVTYPEDIRHAEYALTPQKKLFLSEPLGFCGGVKRALEIYTDIHTAHPDTPLYLYRELVHNDTLNRSILQDGSHIVNDIQQIPDGSMVLLGAHGVTKDVLELAAQRHLKIYNALCPLVAKLQNDASQLAPDIPLIFYGDENHAEVRSILNHAATKYVYILKSLDDVQKLPTLKKAVLMCQTTLNEDSLEELICVLKQRIPELVNHASICQAVTKRQKAIAKLSQKCDLTMVVGSSHSANGTQLLRIAQKYSPDSVMIENADCITSDMLIGIRSIALGAATSTPDFIIKSVVDKLNHLGFITPESVKLVDFESK